MKASAVTCLSRGIASLVANWKLVPVNFAGLLLVVLLVLLGLAVPFAVLGSDLLSALVGASPEQAGRLLRQAVDRMAEPTPALAAALVGTAAVWLLAFLVHCWLAAGTYGVLVSAERQARPHGARDWRWFRTFSLRDFCGWGGRYLWRFAGFALLSLVVGVALAVGAALLFVLAAMLGESRGAPAALGVGCGGALPLAFLLLATLLWSWLAQADLAREGSSVFRAARQAASVLGRRLGGTLLLAFVFAVLSLVALGGLALASLLAGLALADLPAVKGTLAARDRALLLARLHHALDRLRRRPGRPVARRSGDPPHGMNARRLRSLLLALLALAACGRSLPPPVTPVPPVPPPPVEPPAPPAPAEEPEPEPRPEPPVAPGPAVPIALKVGLATDLATVTLPCCDGGVTARVGDRVLALASPITVEPAVGAAERGVWRLQVAALRDERQAQELARRLERETGEPGDAHFDAGIDLYRVRIGRWTAREEADAAARRLAAKGLAGAFVVSEGGRVERPGAAGDAGGDDHHRSRPLAGARGRAGRRGARPGASATAVGSSST